MGFFCLPLLLVCPGLSTALLILLRQPPGLSPAPPLLCRELSQPATCTSSPDQSYLAGHSQAPKSGETYPLTHCTTPSQAPKPLLCTQMLSREPPVL